MSGSGPLDWAKIKTQADLKAAADSVKPTGRPTGRPSTYNEEIADLICRRLMDGESLLNICRDREMPETRTIFKWLAANKGEFVRNYTHAREVQGHLAFEEAREIVETDPDPVRARLRFDQRRWAAGKLLPKVYGDKVQHTGDGGGAVTLNVITGVPRADDPE